MITMQCNSELLHGLKVPERSLLLLMADDDRMGGPTGTNPITGRVDLLRRHCELLHSRSSAFFRLFFPLLRELLSRSLL